MLPVVCILRAGLYVGLGSFGMAAAKLVFKGSLPGSGGPPAPGGIPLGPAGLDEEFEVIRESESKDARPS